MDEHITAAIASGLRRRGIQVATALEVNLLGASDEAHLQFTYQSRRVMVMHDDDYLRLHAGGTPPARIAFCKQGRRSIGEMLQALILIHDVLSPDEMDGKIEYL